MPAVEGSSVSETLWLKTFSVGQVSAVDQPSWDIFFSIYLPFLLIVQVPNFLNLWDHKVGSSSELWYQSSVYFPIMNNMLYSFWGNLYYSHIPCVFSEFLYAYDVFFPKKLIQRVPSYLVSLWFSSPASVTCNVLCLSTKVLSSFAIF